jgi:hypothetical protein
VQNLQTNKGRARVDGLQSQLCDVDVDHEDGPLGSHPADVVSRDAALMGVLSRLLIFAEVGYGASGLNLSGWGTQGATVRYDVLGLPPSALSPDSVLDQLIEGVDRALKNSRR